MQVVLVNTNKIWGGGEKWHWLMAQRLKSTAQINVIVIAGVDSPLYYKTVEAKIPVSALQIGNLSFLNPFKLYKLYRFFKKHQVQAVVFGLPKDLKSGALAAKWAGVNKIIYARALASPVKNSGMNRFLFGKVVTHVVCNSQETLKKMLFHNPKLVPQQKQHIIYYGLTDPYSIPVPQAQNRIFIIGNAGRLTSQKAQHLFIPIAKQLIGMGLEFEIHIAGDGELRETLMQQVKDANLEARFRFLGFVTDISHFMTSIDVFCLTSLWEGFGYVIAEAHLAEKPVVAFDISSNPEVIEHQKDGFLIPPQDVESMTEKLFLLASNANLKTEMGKEGRKKVLTKFSSEKEMKQWTKLILE